MKTPFHAAFSMLIRTLSKKENTRRLWQEGFFVCGIKHVNEELHLNGEIWSLHSTGNVGAVFTADGTLQRGIYTDGAAVRFVKPEELSVEEQARLVGMFPKKL